MDKSKKNLLSALQFIDNPYIWIKARRKMKNIVKRLFFIKSPLQTAVIHRVIHKNTCSCG